MRSALEAGTKFPAAIGVSAGLEQTTPLGIPNLFRGGIHYIKSSYAEIPEAFREDGMLVFNTTTKVFTEFQLGLNSSSWSDNNNFTSNLRLAPAAANMSALSIKGNATNSTAASQDIIAGASETFLGRAADNTLSFVKITAGYITDRVISTAKIILNAITNAELSKMPALSVKSNATNTLADPQDIAAGTSETLFGRTGLNTLAFFKLTANYITDRTITAVKIVLNSITNEELAQAPGPTVKGNTSGSTGNLQDIYLENLYSNNYKGIGHYGFGNSDNAPGSYFTQISTVQLTSINGTTPFTSLIGTAGDSSNKTRKAGTWIKGQQHLLEGFGLNTFTDDNASTLEIRLVVLNTGGTTVLCTTGANFGSIVTNKGFRYKIVVTCRSLRNGATMGKLSVQGFFTLIKSDGSTLNYDMETTAEVDFDNTLDNYFDLQAQWVSTVTTNNIKHTDCSMIKK